MDTNLLIDRLAADNAPVQCLRCPARRTTTWLALAVPYVMAVAWLLAKHSDFAGMASDQRLMIEQIAALATAVAAAFAAFAITVPGYDRRILLLPALPLLIWLGSLCVGSADEFVRDGIAGLWLRPEWVCVRWILAIGTVPAIVLVFMLRKGAPMAPYTTAALGGLAAASLAHFCMRAFQPEEVSVLMLVWHTGTLVAVSIAAGWLGRIFMSWRAATGPLRRKLAAG